MFLLAGGAAAATKLTPANSVSFPFASHGTAEILGTGCGTTGTATKPLAEGATAIKVTEPKVGARDGTGDTRVSAVTLAGTVITVSVVADGARVCDPARSDEPVSQRTWTGTYEVRAEYTRRVQVPLRVDLSGPTKSALSPATVKISPDEKVTGVKWKRFGSKEAIGRGTLRQGLVFGCRRGNCPQGGKRMRLVASKPGYCQDSGEYEYRIVTGYLGRRLFFKTGKLC